MTPSTAPLPAAAETVLTFLASIGRRSEAEFYLRLFRKLPKQSFALIAVGNPVVEHALGSLLGQLRFLAQLGLHAPVVVGLFEHGDAAAQRAERLRDRMPTMGLVPVPRDARQADLITDVCADLVAGRVPVLSFAGGPSSLRVRERILSQLADGLGTCKLVVVRRSGAIGEPNAELDRLAADHLLETHDEGISMINLTTDAQLLLDSGLLPREDSALLMSAQRLLNSCEPSFAHVSVTSPLNLLRELFTVKGAGTLIKRGSAILTADDYAGLDVLRLTQLLEHSFGRSLRPEFFERQPNVVFLEAGYRGAAVVESSAGVSFLSKFAVGQQARGEGVGWDLWQALVRRHRSLFWRGRPNNPIDAWYARQCEGMVRLRDWHVFWRGVEPKMVPQLVQRAQAMPVDFID